MSALHDCDTVIVTFATGYAYGLDYVPLIFGLHLTSCRSWCLNLLLGWHLAKYRSMVLHCDGLPKGRNGKSKLWLV